MPQIVLLAHNLRSAHNVGSLLRTTDGLGIGSVYLTGYTPYPLRGNDQRMPHLATKIDRRIAKTALGAERTVNWYYTASIEPVIAELRSLGYLIAALEQTPDSQPLPDYQPPERIAIVLGREVEGLEPEILRLCDTALEIPMFGHKESFNVVQAAAMALYHCRFASRKTTLL